MFEKVFNTAKGKAEADGKEDLRQGRPGHRLVARARTFGGPGLLLNAARALFDKLVYSRLRAGLGGKRYMARSRAAPRSATGMGHFFRGIGVTVYEGYGLTETSRRISVNYEPGDQRRHRR